MDLFVLKSMGPRFLSWKKLKYSFHPFRESGCKWRNSPYSGLTEWCLGLASLLLHGRQSRPKEKTGNRLQDWFPVYLVGWCAFPRTPQETRYLLCSFKMYNNIMLSKCTAQVPQRCFYVEKKPTTFQPWKLLLTKKPKSTGTTAY